ncbi:MAG: sodium-dependent transporter [Alphaproteobacteria bacterium]
MARELWSSRTGFVLAAAGSAVGLGNIWKFPYLAGKFGGGAFLLAYLLLVFTVVKAVMLSEIAIGRAAQKNPVGSFAKLHNNRWKIVGYMGVAAAFMILSFYSVVAGWTIHYTFEMASGALSSLQPDALGGKFGGFITDPVSPIIYHAVFMAVVVAIVIRGVKGGIEKTSRILMPVLFALVIVLILRGLTLPGAEKGLAFYLIPDWSQLGNGELWSAALGQAFFSLSLGMGTMLTYGSYLAKKENLPSTAMQVSFVDTGIAFLAGLLVLPAVFAFGFDNGAGPGLTFITLPAVFNQIWGGQLFGTLFFVLLAFAALTSAISILEVLVAWWSEEKGASRKNSAIIFGIITFFVGIACSYSLGIWSKVTIASIFGLDSSWKLLNLGVFDLLDYLSSNVLLPLGGLFILIFVGWVKPQVMMKEITNNGKVDFSWKGLFVVMAKFISPLAIAYVLLKSIGIA